MKTLHRQPVQGSHSAAAGVRSRPGNPPNAPDHSDKLVHEQCVRTEWSRSADSEWNRRLREQGADAGGSSPCASSPLATSPSPGPCYDYPSMAVPQVRSGQVYCSYGQKSRVTRAECDTNRENNTCVLTDRLRDLEMRSWMEMCVWWWNHCQWQCEQQPLTVSTSKSGSWVARPGFKFPNCRAPVGDKCSALPACIPSIQAWSAPLLVRVLMRPALVRVMMRKLARALMHPSLVLALVRPTLVRALVQPSLRRTQCLQRLNSDTRCQVLPEIRADGTGPKGTSFAGRRVR